MSTRIGLVTEGPIDLILLRPLLEQVAHQYAGYDWPVDVADAIEHLPLRKRGHGAVLVAVKRIVTALAAQPLDYAFVVIVLDERTSHVQRQLRQLIAGRERFVLGIARRDRGVVVGRSRQHVELVCLRHPVARGAALRQGRLPRGE
jgi:hypothetical protein